jgi:hypothetical protein
MEVTASEDTAALVEIQSRLEALAAALASGKSDDVEQRAGQLDTALKRLVKLRETFSGTYKAPGSAAGLGPALHRIRARCAALREAAARGEAAVRALAGILALLYNAEAGAQYSACGSPSLPSAPRLRAEA